GLLDLDGNPDQNNIQYFNYNYDPGAPASDVITLNGMTVPVQIDALPTKANVANAITEWARDRMDPGYIYHPGDPSLEHVGKPANLYIIMIDHGLKDAFYIGENEFGENEVITPTELDGWLDTLQTSLEGTSAQQQEIITMIGACYSGSFIEHIRGPNRVIITSAAGDEVSYRGPKDTVDDEGTVIRDGEYFITEFFKKIRIGKSIKQSFESACALTEIFTSSNVEVYNATSLLRYNDKSRQHPLLEDDNEGPWGSNDLFDPNGDGSNSADLVIGTTYQIVNAYDVVSVNQVANTIFLEEGEDWTDELWATANKQVITVWCEIKPPYFDLIGGGHSQVTMDLDEYLGCFIEEMGRWEWSEENTSICESSQNIGGFTSPGTYQVFYFAKDKIDGAVSDLKTTWVYKAKKGNSAPNSFSLISPVAENSERTTLLLDWEDTNDPDGDTFTYTVLLSGKESEICDGDPSMCICSDDLFENPIRIEGLTNSAYVVTPMDGIRDLHHYCWKVQAIDQYGAITETDFGEFYTEDTNDPRCWVQIFLRDSSTQAPISNATVSVQGGDETITGLGGDHSGFYLGGVQPFPTNTYVVIQAPGYETFTYPADSGNFPSNGEFVRMFDLSVGIDKVAAPSIGPSSQPPGFYLCHQAVELTCATPGATIRYTNDGSEPSSSSPVYRWPMIIRETMTIKARAFKDGYDPSEVLTLEYTLSHPVSDLDEEGDVDGVDLALFIHYYNDEDNWADLNGDNAFNEIDISKFAEQFGSVPDSQ
ncbi:MAG: hypothetical protein DRQ58_09175, partial [Gammaproteobacteria bacterium]